MPSIPGLRRVFRFPSRTARSIAEDVDEELRFHLDMRAAELAARRGLDPGAARAEALRQFGDLEDARSYIRSLDRRTETATRRRQLMETVRQDLVLGLRGLRRSPGFAAIVVLALAVGIGAATAVFTVVNAVMIRPLPVPHPERLVGFGDPTLVGTFSSGFPRSDLFSYGLYTDLRDGTRLVPELFASGGPGRLDVVVRDGPGGAEPEHPRGRLVSGNYFAVLGVRPILGRALTPADDAAPGAGPVAVISHAYWQRRFGGDPAAVGRSIRVNGTPLTVVGVAPEGFSGEVVGAMTDLWIPLTMQPDLTPGQDWLKPRDTNWLMMMGRLRPGATFAQAEAEFSAIARPAIREASTTAPAADAPEPRIDAYPGARGFSWLRDDAGTALATLMGLVGLVLLVVGANVANLLLARAAARRTEIGVRLALGAGRGRVVRQLLTESLLLGAAAGTLALLVVAGGMALLLRRAAEDGGGGMNLDLSLDARVLGFAAGLSLATAVLLGLLPAVRATYVDLAVALRSHARGLSGDPLAGGGRRLGLGKWLVVGQVALSLVLLAGTGLLVRSVENLESTDMGVARDEILVVTVDAQATGRTGEHLRALHGRLAERLGRVPGVRAVTYSQNGILTGSESTTTLQVPGFVARAAADTSANFDRVGPGYFRTVGARLLRGRDIEARDDANAPRVAVINQTMAKFYFGAGDPLGRSLQVDAARYEIVGVAADVTHGSLREAPSRRFYTPLAQDESGWVVFMLRTAGDPARAAAAARREVLAADPALRVIDSQPLATVVKRSVAGERWVARTAGAAGGLALVLAALGLYGVMTYTIVRRTSEFGLRIALGARPADVALQVLRETMLLVLLGTAIGVPAVLGAARLLRHQLVGVGLVDPPTFAAALAVLAASAALAGLRPASRAGRVAPQVALAGD